MRGAALIDAMRATCNGDIIDDMPRGIASGDDEALARGKGLLKDGVAIAAGHAPILDLGKGGDQCGHEDIGGGPALTCAV